MAVYVFGLMRDSCISLCVVVIFDRFVILSEYVCVFCPALLFCFTLCVVFLAFGEIDLGLLFLIFCIYVSPSFGSREWNLD